MKCRKIGLASASLVVLAGTAVGTASPTSISTWVVRVTPPEGCYVCITEQFWTSLATNVVTFEDCPSTFPQIAVDATPVLVATGDNCLGAASSSSDASLYTAISSAEAGTLFDFSSFPPAELLIRAETKRRKAKNECTTAFESQGALASGYVVIEIRNVSDDLPCSGTVSIEGETTLPASPVSSANGRVVTFVPSFGLCNTDLSYIQTVAGACGDGIDATGMFNSSATCSTTGGQLDFDPKVLNFSDAQFDANGDGRFNEKDWPIIQSLLNSTAPADLAKYNVCPEGDIDGDEDPTNDQIIAQEDLDLIRAALDAGLGAGILGDWNGDDKVDCTDFAALPASLNATICDPAYKVTLDADLDGDNDAADLAAVLALFPTADLAAPFGVLDLSDINAFVTWFSAQDPQADIAPPFGVFDLIDLNTFTSAFDNPCP